MAQIPSTIVVVFPAAIFGEGRVSLENHNCDESRLRLSFGG